MPHKGVYSFRNYLWEFYSSFLTVCARMMGILSEDSLCVSSSSTFSLFRDKIDPSLASASFKFW